MALGSQSVDTAKSYFVCLSIIIGGMILDLVGFFYAKQYLGWVAGFAVGGVGAVLIFGSMWAYYVSLKRGFGRFGLSIQLFFPPTHEFGYNGIGLWVPNKVVTRDDGMQIAPTGIKQVPNMALDWKHQIKDEPRVRDLIFWKSLPFMVETSYLTAKFVGEYESKPSGEHIPKFKALFAPSMLEETS